MSRVSSFSALQRVSGFSRAFLSIRQRGHPSNDWNSCESLFSFTRGRFVVDEADQVARRYVKFNMNELARIAAQSIGAKFCIDIQKCPDGMYNKCYVLTMDDGKEVIAKVPNPNAGRPHFTTASEVATMDFARNVLGTPAPKVYTWDSCATNPVGVEYIIMEKIPGIQLRQVWSHMKLVEKMNLCLDLARYQSAWLSVTFSRFGGLYYTQDAQDLNPGQKTHLYIDEKGTPCAYKRYREVCSRLLQSNRASGKVGYFNFGHFAKTDGYDWQSVNILPLLDHNPDASFIDYDGPEPENLDRPELDNIDDLSESEKVEAVRKFHQKALFIASRKIMLKKVPKTYDAIEYQRTESYDLLVLARRLLEFGEAHFHALVVELREAWAGLPANNTNMNHTKAFPITPTKDQIAEIRIDCQNAIRGMQIMNDFKVRLGPLWPDKDAVGHEQYNATKDALRVLREEIIQEFGKSEADKIGIKHQWPFDG
ncbi:hypothetical protein A7C99_4948 [Trichophyton rubrum]|uniref:Altered inheritance of mitochondria protein 9, mitochondrial n=1 Tax=Trichophyton rubrum TaxID=5551 RepID=A0A178EWJ2_TRIRU|nr:hypothetical protein A7C99_4948 [Trichophyton rubrum]